MVDAGKTWNEQNNFLKYILTFFTIALCQISTVEKAIIADLF